MKREAYIYEFQSKVVYFRLEESEIGRGIMGGVSFAANNMWGVLESCHTRLHEYQQNYAHIWGQNVRMIIIIAVKINE
jgi:hypothetical protein